MEMIRAGMMDSMTGAGGPLVNLATEKRSDNRALLAEKLGISVDLLDGLAGMKIGETSPEIEAALAEAGLAQVNYDGSITMTGPGRSMLAAANSGDVDKAEKANSDAKEGKAKAEAKGSGGGGGKGKGKAEGKTAKQRADEAKEAKLQEEAKNREKVADKMDDVDAGMVGDLNTFANGEEIPEENAKALARAGLAEYDSDGKLRMTSQGRKFNRAANKGEVREALDTLSLGREKVDEIAQRATTLREDAAELDEAAGELDIALAEAEIEYANLVNAGEVDAEQLSSVRRQLDQYIEQSEGYKERANAIRREAEKLEEQIGGIPGEGSDAPDNAPPRTGDAPETEGGALLGRLMAAATAEETRLREAREAAAAAVAKDKPKEPAEEEPKEEPAEEKPPKEKDTTLPDKDPGKVEKDEEPIDQPARTKDTEHWSINKMIGDATEAIQRAIARWNTNH